MDTLLENHSSGERPIRFPPQGKRMRSSFKKASRHSGFVRFARLLLVFGCIGVGTTYIASFFQVGGLKRPVAEMDISTFIPKDIAMSRPTYRGFSKDGGSYLVTAEEARPNFSNGKVELVSISGELVDSKASKVALSAERGTFETESGFLRLYDKILLTSPGDFQADLHSAIVETKEGMIRSNDSVKVLMPTGLVTSNVFFLRSKIWEMNFMGDVSVHIGQQEGGTLFPARDMVGSSGSSVVSMGVGFDSGSGFLPSFSHPIDIFSNELTIFRKENRARFTGAVRAIQEDAALYSHQLEVYYSGEGGVGASTGGATRVERIVSSRPIFIKKGQTQEVTARSAEFKVQEGSAILSGSVILSSGADSRARSDRVIFDTKDNTVLLTGKVLVVQEGASRLSGEELRADLLKGTVFLSALPTSGGSQGRVSARFVLPTSPGGDRTKKSHFDLSTVTRGKDSNGVEVGEIFIEADKLRVDDVSKKAVFSKNVKVKHTGFALTSRELTATYSGKSGLASSILVGKEGQTQKKKTDMASNVVLERVRADGQVTLEFSSGRTTVGEWIDFDIKQNNIRVGGDVLFKEGQSVVHGKLVRINIKTGEVVVESSGSSSGDSSPKERKDEEALIRKGKSVPGSADSSRGRREARPSIIFYPSMFQTNSNQESEKRKHNK